MAVVERECLVLGRLEGRVGRLWRWQRVQMLGTKEAALGRVWQLVEHFGGDMVSQGVVLTGEHLHRVLRRDRLTYSHSKELFQLWTHLKLSYLFSQLLNL